MSYAPTSGRYATVKKKATPSDVELPAMDWKFDGDAKTANASNFRDGRRREATLADGTLTLNLCWDQDAEPTDTAGLNLRLGTKLDVKGFVDGDASTAPTKFFLFPVIVSKIGVGSKVEGEIVMYPVTCELNGSITYPV